jgi:hypothetical protein
MSKSTYFEEIEFKTPESPGDPKRPKTVIRPNPEKIKEALEKIDAELKKITTGDSDLTHYAINNGNFGSPVGNAFKRLRGKSSIENIKAFVELAGQDLGVKAQLHFKKILTATLEEVPNV